MSKYQHFNASTSSSTLVELHSCQMSVSPSSNEDVDEGFVINQEGIGLRLTAMEYWKCSKVGITLPFAQKKEPDCKFVIAESLPEQGRRGAAPRPRKCVVSALFKFIAALHHCC